MNKDVAVIAIHGMGDTKKDFADDLKDKLLHRLGNDHWRRVHFDTVYYQDILQKNQNATFRSMRKNEIDFIKLRKFLLFGFSDAAGLERNAHKEGSPYERAQSAILKTIDKCADKLGGFNKPVVIVAHSLGCQVISNYIWDSQTKGPKQGIWKNTTPDNTEDNKFRRLKTLKTLFTTGCNIPIFVAGFPRKDIKAIKTNGNGYNFKWRNYYDQDDVLGWPLKPLSDSYRESVYKDEEINADGGFLGKLIRGWNPMSHGGYWTDKQFLKPLSKEIMRHIDL